MTDGEKIAQGLNVLGARCVTVVPSWPADYPIRVSFDLPDGQTLQRVVTILGLENPWERGFRHAVAFHETHGHLRVPSRYLSPDGYNLGSWMAVQRRRHNGTAPKGERVITPDEIERLNKLGMVWSLRAEPKPRGQRAPGALPPPRVRLATGTALLDQMAKVRALAELARSRKEVGAALEVTAERVRQILRRMPDGEQIDERLRANRRASKAKAADQEPRPQFKPTQEEISELIALAKDASRVRRSTPADSSARTAKSLRDQIVLGWRGKGMSIPAIAHTTGISAHTLRTWKPATAGEDES